MNEIFLYGGVYSWSAQDILTKMSEIGADKDITFRTNSGGGDVFAAQGILADMKKRTGKNIQSMEGTASSMAFFWGLYMDKVTALETTKALVHRADMWVENQEDALMLADVNENFKKEMRNRLNIKAFEKRVGMTLDQFFDPGMNNSVRHEAWLSASDLVAIGMVKEEDVLKLTPEIEAMQKVTASFDSYREPKAVEPIKEQEQVIINNNNSQTMEASERKAVLTAEQNRVAAWMVWAEVDLAKVKAGIESGKEISEKETQEFVLAMNDKTKLKELEANSQGKIDTPKVEPTAEEKADAEYKQAEAELKKAMGIKLED